MLRDGPAVAQPPLLVSSLGLRESQAVLPARRRRRRCRHVFVLLVLAGVVVLVLDPVVVATPPGRHRSFLLERKAATRLARE